MRMMASSWRTVIGIEERALASSSALCTCLRMETKWDESFSAASGERRGAQRLELFVNIGGYLDKNDGGWLSIMTYDLQ